MVEEANRAGMKQRMDELEAFLAEQTTEVTEYDEGLVRNPALRQKYRCKRSHHAGAPSGASFFVCPVEKFTGACYTYKVIG